VRRDRLLLGRGDQPLAGLRGILLPMVIGLSGQGLCAGTTALLLDPRAEPTPRHAVTSPENHTNSDRPRMLDNGTGPQARLSKEWSRLSPIMNTCPSGTTTGPKSEADCAGSASKMTV